MNLSAVIVSFKSFHLIEKHIHAIGENHQIIVVENSQDITVKKKLEKLYRNVEVVIPKSNLGYGAALNLGVKKSKNNFVLCMVADLNVNQECFINILNIVSQFKEFSILAPTYLNEEIYKNYLIFNKELENFESKKISSFTLKEVDDIDGAFFLINKEKFNDPSIMDEKIFLYFESSDLCFRLRKKNQKLYVIENIKFDHLGKQSSHPRFQKETLITRNWHYNWSKFYFYRKHYNYFFAFRKSLPNLRRSIKMCIYYKFKKDDYNYKLHKAEFSGLINAYLLRRSFYRPNIN